MANVKISQLPEYTGNTSGSWLIMNNSGETTTYKVKKENIVPAGGGLFAQTGSFWNTTNNIGITGSLVVRGEVTSNLNTGLFNYSYGNFNLGSITSGATTNIALGLTNLTNVTNGNFNIAVGQDVLRGVTTGSYNIAIGKGAASQRGNSYNIAIGYNALGVIEQNGSNLVGIGAYAGRFETGSNKIIIDNISRNSISSCITGSLFYGTTNANPNLQTLRLNAAVTIPNNVDITGSLNVSGSIPAVIVTGSINLLSGSLAMRTAGTLNITSLNASSSLVAFATNIDSSLVLSSQDSGATARSANIEVAHAPVIGGPQYWANFYKESGSFKVRTSQQVGTNSYTNRDAIVIKDTLSGATTYSPVEFKRNVEVTGSFSQSGSVYITGSVQGNVNALTISSNTASLNLDNGNFFTLQLASGSSTHINPSNIKPGQTANMLINTTGSVTVNFPSSVKQPSGSAYVPSVNGSDVLTFVSFDNSTLYVANVRNLI